MWLYQSTTNAKMLLAVLIGPGLLTACGSSYRGGLTLEEEMHGDIAYPFAQKSPFIGENINQSNDKLVIRSLVGNREYVVEIPGAARDYNVEVPLDTLTENDDTTNFEKLKKLPSTANTDKELVRSLPDRMGDNPFQAGKSKPFLNPSEQAPSYSVGLARIADYYRKKEYELALIEINNLITYYPNSPKLYKMKGTVLLKTGDLELAARAWFNAHTLDPDDKILSKSLDNLKKKLN